MTPQFVLSAGILLIIVALFLLFQARYTRLLIRSMELQRGSFMKFLNDLMARTGPDTAPTPSIPPIRPKNPPTGGRTVRTPTKLP